MSRVDGTEKKQIGVWKLLIGILFLVNPYFNLIDLLPDAIGYYLILRGLGESIYAVPSFQAAAKSMRYLIGVSLLRPLGFLVVSYFSSVSDNIIEAPMMCLLLVCCLLVAEGYLFFGMIRDLFEGISYAILQVECADMLNVPSDRRKKRAFLSLSKLRGKTLRFFVYKSLANLLPELAVLGVNEEGYVDSVTDNQTLRFLQLRNVLTVLFFVILLIASIVIWNHWRRWLRSIRMHARFLPALEEWIRKTPEPEAHRMIRTSKLGCLLLSLACCLLWAIRLDGWVIVPTFLGATAIAWAVRSLCLDESIQKRLLWQWRVLAVLYGGSWLSNNLFSSRYYKSGSARGAEGWFIANIALTMICGALLLVLLMILTKSLIAYLDRHGFASVDPTLARMAKEAENRKNQLKFCIWLVSGTAIIPIACDVYETIALYADEIKFNLVGVEQGLPVWGILIALRLVWVVFAMDTFSRIRIAVRERYTQLA